MPSGRPAARELLGPTGHEPAVPTRRVFLTRAVGVLTLAGAAVAAGNVLGARALSRARGVLPVAGRRAVRPPASTPIPGRTALVTTTAALYRIDTALSTPAVDPDGWQLTLSGLVDRPLTFDYADLLRMPQLEAWITLGCVGNDVGGDLVGTVLWQGVLLVDLLRAAGVQPAATQLVGRSGQHTIAVRATDGRGQVQPAEQRDVLSDGATRHHTVQVSVA